MEHLKWLLKVNWYKHKDNNKMNSLLDDFPVPKRVLPIIFIVETSGGMSGERIDAVNKAIKSALPVFQEVS